MIRFGLCVLFMLSLFTVRSQWTPEDIRIALDNETDSPLGTPVSRGLMASILNQLEIPQSLAPLELHLNSDSGDIRINVRYDHEKIFEKGSLYHQHNENIIHNTYNRGISVLFENKLFTALGMYVQTFVLPTRKFWPVTFDGTLSLVKSNGDQMNFYSTFQKASTGYTIRISEKSSGNVALISFETTTSDPYALQKMSYYFVGKPTNKNNSKTGAYYFCKFFEIDLK